jgi:hypothetical protein
MAKFKPFTATGKVEILKDFEEKIRKKFEGAMLRNFKKEALPPLVDAINRAITAEKEHFQPLKQGGVELAAQLGVGRGGEILTNKLNSAWKLLLIADEDSVSKASLFLSKGSKFGKFQFTINRDAFYNAARTTYLSTQSKEFGKIQWMKNYLRGIPTIDGYRFVGRGERGFNEEKSRTGEGIMKKTRVPSKQFSLQGYGEKKAFGAIEDAINSRLKNNKFKTDMKNAIRRALRRG